MIEQTVAGNRAVSLRIVLVLLLISPIEQLGFDITAPALPSIGDEFGASNEFVQNSMTTYALGMAVGVLPVGLISDSIGRKRILLAALALVGTTCLGCALAPNLALVLVLRFFQGIGSGGCMMLTGVIAADRFSGVKLISVVGLLGASWGCAPVLGPAIGGLTVEIYSWRWTFVIFGAIAVLATILVACLVPETLSVSARVPLRLRRAAWVVRSSLRNRAFASYTGMFGVVCGAMLTFGVTAPFLFEDVLGFSPRMYGFVALAVGGAGLLGAVACSWLVHRMSARQFGVAAWMLLMGAASALIVSAYIDAGGAWSIAIAGAVAMFALGALDPFSKGLAMSVFTENKGLLGGLLYVFSNLFIAISMAAMAFLPEETSAPLGWAYAASGVFVIGLLLIATTTDSDGVEAPAGGRKL